MLVGCIFSLSSPGETGSLSLTTLTKQPCWFIAASSVSTVYVYSHSNELFSKPILQRGRTYYSDTTKQSKQNNLSPIATTHKTKKEAQTDRKTDRHNRDRQTDSAGQTENKKGSERMIARFFFVTVDPQKDSKYCYYLSTIYEYY